MTRPIARAAAVVLWLAAVAVIWVSVVWGRRFQHESPEILGVAPLVGRNPRGRLGLAVRLGPGRCRRGGDCGGARGGRGWWWRARLRWVVVASSIGAGAFATSLALTDGADGVLRGAAHETEYVANLAVAPPAGEFVRTFVERIDDYSVHERGHPPGFVLVLKLLDAVGLDGVWPAGVAVDPGGRRRPCRRARRGVGGRRRLVGAPCGSAAGRRPVRVVDGDVGRCRVQRRRRGRRGGRSDRLAWRAAGPLSSPVPCPGCCSAAWSS